MDKQAFDATMRRAGVRPFHAAPPAIRLLWAMGWMVRPPIYWTTWAVFWFQGLLGGVSVVAAIWLIDVYMRHNVLEARAYALLGAFVAVAFGTAGALVHRRDRQKIQPLPQWQTDTP